MIDQLPFDLLKNVFCFSDAWSVISSYNRVCRSWYYASFQDDLWMALCQTEGLLSYVIRSGRRLIRLLTRYDPRFGADDQRASMVRDYLLEVYATLRPVFPVFLRHPSFGSGQSLLQQLEMAVGPMIMQRGELSQEFPLGAMASLIVPTHLETDSEHNTFTAHFTPLTAPVCRTYRDAFVYLVTRVPGKIFCHERCAVNLRKILFSPPDASSAPYPHGLHPFWRARELDDPKRSGLVSAASPFPNGGASLFSLMEHLWAELEQYFSLYYAGTPLDGWHGFGFLATSQLLPFFIPHAHPLAIFIETMPNDLLALLFVCDGELEPLWNEIGAVPPFSNQERFLFPTFSSNSMYGLTFTPYLHCYSLSVSDPYVRFSNLFAVSAVNRHSLTDPHHHLCTSVVRVLECADPITVAPNIATFFANFVRDVCRRQRLGRSSLLRDRELSHSRFARFGDADAHGISEAQTSGIHVTVQPCFLGVEMINNNFLEYSFSYQVRMYLAASSPYASVQLLSRRWLIIDASGEVAHTVEGPGVIGLHPLLQRLSPEEELRAGTANNTYAIALSLWESQTTGRLPRSVFVGQALSQLDEQSYVWNAATDRFENDPARSPKKVLRSSALRKVFCYSSFTSFKEPLGFMEGSFQFIVLKNRDGTTPATPAIVEAKIGRFKCQVGGESAALFGEW